MTRLLKAASICAVAVLLAAPHSAGAADQPSHREAEKAGKDCFRTRNIQGYAAADDDNIYIRVGVRDVYHLAMRGRCPNIEWNEGVAIVSHGSAWICTDRDAEVITRTRIGPQRCPIESIRKLTPEQVEALPRRARP